MHVLFGQFSYDFIVIVGEDEVQQVIDPDTGGQHVVQGFEVSAASLGFLGFLGYLGYPGSRVSGLLGQLGPFTVVSMDEYNDVALQPLTDEAIEAMSPMVKALVAKRLEAMFQECRKNLAEAEPGRGDARWMELMVRIADRQARIFRFDRVAVAGGDDGQDEDAARVVRAGIEARVSASLDELEQRSRAD